MTGVTSEPPRDDLVVKWDAPLSPNTLPGSREGEAVFDNRKSDFDISRLRTRSCQRLFSEGDVQRIKEIPPKKSRRRRGQKGRRWKPYHKLTTEEKIAKDEREEKIALERRARLFSFGKPMAPYNTTQFLLEDRERRITADSDGDSVTGSVPAIVPTVTNTLQGVQISPNLKNDERCRVFSGSDTGANSSESGSVSDEEDEMLEREFEAEYDSANLMRIDGMSREQVTREMMLLEQNNGKLADRLCRMQMENEKLKELLRQNGVSFDEQLQKKRRKSGDSFTSDSGVVAG